MAGSWQIEMLALQTRPPAQQSPRLEVFAALEGNFLLALAPNWSLHAVAAIEPLTDPRPSENRFFANEDGRWKDVYIEYTTAAAGVRAGRISAPFGQAWWAAPGLDGTTLAEDYALWDRAGAMAWHRFAPTPAGTITLAAALYRIDTSWLSRSWQDTRHQHRLTQGGPANTRQPRSWALALDGTEMPGWPGLDWHLAVMRQSSDFILGANGQRDSRVSDESGLVAGFTHRHAFSSTTQLTTLVEWAHLSDRGGTDGQRSRLLTLGESIETGDWTLQASVSRRTNHSPDAPALMDRLVALSAGFRLAPGISVESGWRRLTLAGSAEEAIALTLRFQSAR